MRFREFKFLEVRIAVQTRETRATALITMFIQALLRYYVRASLSKPISKQDLSIKRSRTSIPSYLARKGDHVGSRQGGGGGGAWGVCMYLLTRKVSGVLGP